MILASSRIALASALLLITAAGCGSNSQSKQDKAFFTSGSREADQRADQRMAQAQQLSGDSNNGGQKRDANSNAVVSTDKKSLFEDLGGADGINAIVDDFITRALADPRVNWDRIGVKYGGFSTHHYDSVTWTSDPEHVRVLKLHMAQFLALSTGGPTKYSGQQMSEAHAHMHITNAEFDATLGDLKQTLDKLQIANTEQKELLSIVESTREQIVEER